MLGLICSALVATVPPVATAFLYDGQRHEFKILAGPPLSVSARKAIEDPRYWSGPRTNGKSLMVFLPGGRATAPSFQAAVNGKLVQPGLTAPIWGFGWIGDFWGLDWRKPCRIGISAGPWKTQGTWRANGHRAGLRFVKEVAKLPKPKIYGPYQINIPTFPRVVCKCPLLANPGVMAYQVEAYDSKGNTMPSAGYASNGKTDDFYFSLSTCSFKPAKLGGFKYETRPYQWVSVPASY